MVAVLHDLFNPGPLTLIVSTSGQLMDVQTRMTGDPGDRTLARLIKRGALIDLGPVEAPAPVEPEQEES